MILVLTSNRGLAGGYNGNVVRVAMRDTATGRIASVHDIADVPGDHFSMMGVHAGATAAAVSDWAARLHDRT